jgi:hypothetical protein
VSLCFRTPATKEERAIIWRRKFRPKKELHLLSVQVLLGSITIMLVLAWFQHIRDIETFDKYPSTISFLVADLRTSYGVCFFLAVPFAGHLLYRSHWLTSRYGRKFEGTLCAAMQVSQTHRLAAMHSCCFAFVHITNTTHVYVCLNVCGSLLIIGCRNDPNIS